MEARLLVLLIKIISFADYDGVGECRTCVGGDTVIFTGTATVEKSCDSTFQVTSGFTLTVHLDNSILPLDASQDSGLGHYDGLVLQLGSLSLFED